MHFFPARWTRTLAAATLIVLPVAASAQTTPPPQTMPPAMQQPPTERPADMKDMKVDATAAKQHLGEARDTLSQLTSMPEAARLQGDARTQVTQLISNFNELITTQSDWRAAYGKLDANLSALLGPDSPDSAAPASGVTGAVGTSGTGASQLDPAVRAKLAAFRTNLKDFERAAGSKPGSTPASGVATGTTATPASAMSPAASATGTDLMPASSQEKMASPDSSKAAEKVGHSDADTQLDAISAILKQSKTGTLTKAQTAALKKHVEALRVLLSQAR